ASRAADHDRHARTDGRGRRHAAGAGGGGPMSFDKVAIIGLGLLGGSIGLAVRQHLPGVTTTGYDSDRAVRARAAERGLAGTICETSAAAGSRSEERRAGRE